MKASCDVNLLVLGPQGAGKGTQAKRIAADYAIPHVSTGDMFRDAIAARSELGLQVEPILATRRHSCPTTSRSR